jgi:uncharacterized Tic20 family protein
MNTLPTTEDRVWTVLAHLSALSFGMGILLPVVGWSDQRRKSNYATFQCLQALGYQSLGFTVWVLSYLLAIIAVLIVVIAMSYQAERSGGSLDTFSGPGAILFFVVLFGLFALYFIFPIIAAIACALGKDFRYPLMGDRLARYLNYPSIQNSEEQIWLYEDHEFRWVAAMGHFSILIMLWGMLAPLTAWILQGKQSLFLKFQSFQTLIYQAVTTLIYFGGFFFYLFGVVMLLLSLEGMSGSDFGSSVGIVGMAVMIVSFVIAALFILVVPLLHILGQWAGYRILKGENYRYPMIGKLVEKWILTRTTAEEKPE